MTDVDTVKIVGVHDSSLKELHLREVSLEQTFQLKTRLFPDAQQITIFIIHKLQSELHCAGEN